jgi:hypothetical protein
MAVAPVYALTASLAVTAPDWQSCDQVPVATLLVIAVVIGISLYSMGKSAPVWSSWLASYSAKWSRSPPCVKTCTCGL